MLGKRFSGPAAIGSMSNPERADDLDELGGLTECGVIESGTEETGHERQAAIPSDS